MLNWLLQWVGHYGYFGFFLLLMLGIVGLPVPDETLLVLSGYLISSHRLHPALAFGANLAGSICGTSISYGLGRTLGHAAVLRFGRYVGITSQRMTMVHAWFEKAGEWLVAFCYFIPGIRHFAALVAGTSEMDFRRFAAFAWSGATLWVMGFMALGYFGGAKWQTALNVIHRYTLISVVVIAVVLFAYVWLHRKFLHSPQKSL